MKNISPAVFIIFFSFVLGCNHSKYVSQPLDTDKKNYSIDRGKISIYPARMTEISSNEKLLNLDGLLGASFIYEAISGTRQASYSNINRSSFGLTLNARDFLTQSTEQQTSDSAEINTNSSFTQSTEENNVEGSNTSNSNTNLQADSGSSSSSNSGTSQTMGFVDDSGNIFNYSALTSPENTDEREVAFRELITAVANAQLGGRGLLRRLNLSPLASETHSMYMLPVDINFTPGRHTSINYRGHASLELTHPEDSPIYIIAVAPMGYSQIISEFSSTLSELSASAFAGIGSSGILMEGKLESLIQQLFELDAIVSQPEFAVNISNSNKVEFDYFGSQDLSGSSKLKAQSFQVELIIITNDLDNKKQEITGSALIQKFENSTFNSEIGSILDPDKSPSYSYEWFFTPTKKLKKWMHPFGENNTWEKKSYGSTIRKNNSLEILTTRQFDGFPVIDLNSVSIFYQKEINDNNTVEENGNNYKGFLVFEGTGLDVHRKIKNIYNAEPDERDASQLDTEFEKKLKGFDNVTDNKGSINPDKDLSSFVVTISTNSGDVITHNHINNNSWISDKHIGFDFESREQLRPGQKLNVVLQVRELIKDELENNKDELENNIEPPLETIVLYKTLTISGKKVIPITKGISDLTTKAIPLERGVVAIEISFNQKGVTAGSFEVNGTPIEDFILDKTTDLTNASGEAYERVNKTLKIKLSNDEQELQETSKNKYYLVIKDDSSDEPKVLISKLIEE